MRQPPFPTSSLTHVQMLCLGVRNLQEDLLFSINSPLVELECGGQRSHMDISIRSVRDFPNFPKPFLTMDAVSQHSYCNNRYILPHILYQLLCMWCLCEVLVFAVTKVTLSLSNAEHLTRVENFTLGKFFLGVSGDFWQC